MKKVTDIIKKFNKNKLDDLSRLEQILTIGSPRFGANLNELIKETDDIIRFARTFIYYYRLMEMSIINLKTYKDDKDTLQNIYECVEENYNLYTNVVELIKEYTHSF